MYIRIKKNKKGASTPFLIIIKSICLITIFFIGNNKLFSQQKYFSAYLGSCYGGPIPTEMIENSNGKPAIGFTIGFSYNYTINPKFSIKTDILFTNKKVSYNTNFKKDTLIIQQINNTTYNLNSFYNAYVNGEMNLYYTENHYSISYQVLKKTQLITGFYISLLNGGYDKGKVQVVIGEGGFLGDYFENFDNINNINKFDYGINIGIKTNWFKIFYSEFRLNRSIKTLYSSDIFSNRGLKKNDMYHTYAFFLLGFDIK